MARVLFTPYPEVAAQPRPPADYQDIQSSPAMFGGLIGAAEQRGGAQIEQSGGELFQAGLQRQNLFNQIAADDANNKLQDAYYKVTYGDPNDPSKPGIYGMRGEDALRQGPIAMQALDAARDQIRSGLQNPRQQLEFDQNSRRLQMYTRDAIGRHLDQQQQVYAGAVSKASLDNSLTAAGSTWNDDNAFANSLEGARQGAIRGLQAQFGQNPDPALVTQTLNRVTSEAWQRRILGAAEQNPAYADKLLEQHYSDLDPGTANALKAHLQGKADDSRASAIVSGLTGAIRGQEGSGPNAVSVQGAAGIYQITPGLFQQYATGGEKFANEADREAVSQRALASYNQKYNGDPARVAVAWFSGPGNVAPTGSPTPYLQDRKDANGVSTSTYVNGVVGRMGGQQTAPPPDEATALQRAMDMTKDDPELQAKVVTQLERQFTVQRMATAQQEKQKREAAEADGNAVVTQLLKDPSEVSVDQIANSPNLDYQQKYHLFQMVQANSSEGEMTKLGKTYGSAFPYYMELVHAPIGSDVRMTDPTKLWQLVPTGQLTISGVKELTSEIEARRTPEGEAESAMKKQFFDVAKNEITHSNDLLHLKDPKGEELYLKWMAQALPAYDAGKKQGLTATQMLDPNSKDYIGKSIGQFKRTTNQITSDLMGANSPDLPMAQRDEGPDLNTQAGIVAAYHAGKLTRDAASSALVSKGFASAPQADVVPH